MKNIGLFRHPARLVKRYQGPHEVACGYPTVFEFEGGRATTVLSSLGDTSAFHDLPDGAQVYIEIGVDLDWCSPDVEKIVKEHLRHGRRPKFGQPLPKTEPDVVVCSFCRKENHEVKALIEGPRANICSECIALCFETLQGPKP